MDVIVMLTRVMTSICNLLLGEAILIIEVILKCRIHSDTNNTRYLL